MGSRDAVMDRYCGEAGDYLEEINNGRQGLEVVRQSAMRRMHEKGFTYYKGRGMEFTLIPGDEKLRVRLAKDGGEQVARATPPKPKPTPAEVDIETDVDEATDLGEAGDDDLDLD